MVDQIIGHSEPRLCPKLRIQLHNAMLIYELANRLECSVEFIASITAEVDSLKRRIDFNQGDV